MLRLSFGRPQRMRLGLLVLVAALLVPGEAGAQSRRKAPDGCPWCQDDPEILGRLKAVGHGPFAVGRTPSTEFETKFPASQWVFLETEHMRFASSLGSEKLKAKDRKLLEPDLQRLREAMPELPKKITSLDPWLRLHLLALKCEDFYARFQGLLQVSDEDFPAVRDFDKPFMGRGAFLGEEDKFELVWHANRQAHQRFTKDLMGASVTDSLRWHLTPEHKLLASIPAVDSDLRSHRWLHPHSVHLMSHLFLCAYKHFSYDPPIWLDEGLAHVLEREINPESTTIDGDEGSGPHRGGHEDWRGQDRKLAKGSKAPGFAQMMRWKAFHDMDQVAHRAAWSRVRFLVEEHPEGLARLVGGIKGQLDSQGYPSGSDMAGLQRKLLREIWGWTPASFDAAWEEWALEQGK